MLNWMTCEFFRAAKFTEFLLTIAKNVSFRNPEEYAEAKRNIDFALLAALWNTPPWGNEARWTGDPKLLGTTLSLQFSRSSPAHYLEQRKHIMENRAKARA